MATTSLFFIPTDQNSVPNSTDHLRNTHLALNPSTHEIQTEPQKSRGRKPGSKTSQQNPKKQKRGMGVAKLERLRLINEENNKIVGDTSATVNPNNVSRLPVPIIPDPGVVLQGFPSSIGGCRSSRIFCGGVGSGQIMIDPVCSPWSFVETSTHDQLSSIPNPSHQMYNHCDTCFKKKRLNGDHQNVVRSNGGDFSKYTMIHPMNGYDHSLQPDQRSQEFIYDHRIVKTNPYMGSMEEFGSFMEGNPRNGSEGMKEYEFFPGKYENFPGNFGVRESSVATSDCNLDTIDLSLKL